MYTPYPQQCRLHNETPVPPRLRLERLSLSVHELRRGEHTFDCFPIRIRSNNNAEARAFLPSALVTRACDTPPFLGWGVHTAGHGSHVQRRSTRQKQLGGPSNIKEAARTLVASGYMQNQSRIVARLRIPVHVRRGSRQPRPNAPFLLSPL
jgi:hypothetical protein